MLLDCVSSLTNGIQASFSAGKDKITRNMLSMYFGHSSLKSDVMIYIFKKNKDNIL